jgi:hypothetical protein
MATTTGAPSAYANPFRAVGDLAPSRIDMGVDYFGNGPVYAIGRGVVMEVDQAWLGGFGDVGQGTFIKYRLTDGPKKGQMVYLAEHVSPNVRVGQRVTSNTVIGHMSGGIETGWAAPGTGMTWAMAHGQTPPPPADPGGSPTPAGKSFNNFLKSLGVHSGTGGGKGGHHNQSQLPCPSFIESLLAGPAGIAAYYACHQIQGSTAGKFLGGFISDPVDMLERLGLILLGGLLIVLGIIIMARPAAESAVKEGANIASFVGLKGAGGASKGAGRPGISPEARADRQRRLALAEQNTAIGERRVAIKEAKERRLGGTF